MSDPLFPVPERKRDPALIVLVILALLGMLLFAYNWQKAAPEVREERASISDRSYTSPNLTNASQEDLALQLAWDSRTISERAQICMFVRISPEEAIDEFMSGAPSFNRGNVEKFFDNKCNN